jgi:hypothetical protein
VLRKFGSDDVPEDPEARLIGSVRFGGRCSVLAAGAPGGAGSIRIEPYRPPEADSAVSEVTWLVACLDSCLLQKDEFPGTSDHFHPKTT